MKQIGNYISGDAVVLDNFTSSWNTVSLDPCVFYRHLDDFQESFKQTKGPYSHIDMGQYISVRFAEKRDLTDFYKVHRMYI